MSWRFPVDPRCMPHGLWKCQECYEAQKQEPDGDEDPGEIIEHWREQAQSLRTVLRQCVEALEQQSTEWHMPTRQAAREIALRAARKELKDEVENG